MNDENKDSMRNAIAAALNMTKIPPLKPHEGSWVVVDKASGRAVTEVFKGEKKYLENLNSDYYIETIGTYLARVGEW